MKKVLNIGLDVGSTTVKLVVLNKDLEVFYSKYQRHFSDTRQSIISLIKEALDMYKDYSFRVTFTGSGSLEISEYLDLPFVQEVIACKTAISKYEAKANVAIELGGEDAKIIYFGSTVEQRMNGSCAGGTGAFLDQMAVLLNTDTVGLNELAKSGKTIYPIASRCGVFAKTDIQPLLNEGAKKEDIALSIMQAVVNQTISGLACGKPIRGNVVFLGGPLNYLSELRTRFIRTLNMQKEEILIPENGHLFVCQGAILTNLKGKIISYEELEQKLKALEKFKSEESISIRPLFKTKKEYKEFTERHNKTTVATKDLATYSGDAFLGIDAGSTTAKLVLIDDKGNLLYSAYKGNKGTPVNTIKDMLLEFYDQLPKTVVIRSSGSTGYGELLIKSAFNIDISEIETMAHYKAASHFMPKVNSIIDIGGQDMKYIKIKDNAVDTIMLNEACSSGCGSFIETLAKSLNISIEDFVKNAIESKNPVDLGSRCTVFMNSKIKQTQKEGRSLGDIFAGLSYSVVKNAISKVMKIRNTDVLGNNIVVQGGTFLNDAVLRALEIITEKNVIRPNIAGIMGAYGVALISKDEFLEYEDKDIQSTILNKEELSKLETKTTHARCNRCENNCGLTINMFNNKKFISGNRCEKGAGTSSEAKALPNMYKYKYDKLFDRKSLSDKQAIRGSIGIPRVLNMYENYPFWHTFFTELGFKVVLSDKSSRAIYEAGIESMPSESVCYPAKLVHGHIMNLINQGVKTIFYPCIMYEKKEFKDAHNCYNCPIVTSYPEAIKLNVEELKTEAINYINPFLPLKPDKLLKRIKELSEFREYQLSTKEIRKAIKKAIEVEKEFKEDIIKKGRDILKQLDKTGGKAVVVAGRPYHLDPEVNHGIDTMINHLGLTVLTEDALCYNEPVNQKLRIMDQWVYHSRLYRLADIVSKYENIEIVNLNSFGCGLDAIITDQVEEILKLNNKLYTVVKIDEINNLGAAKIRIRSLIAAMNKRINNKEYEVYEYKKIQFTKEMKKTHTILCPDLSPYHFEIMEAAFSSCGYNMQYIREIDEDTVEEGLKYVNNDACYPSLLVIGQLIKSMKSGKYDPENTSVIISQTGGGCRATNYIGLLRKALKDAGFPDVAIVSFNVSGLEKTPGFKITAKAASRLLMSVVYGDLLMKLLHATRPYESIKGSTNELFNKWTIKCRESVSNGKFKEYRANIKNIVDDFTKIKIEKKNLPKVGVVGEILIKYHPFGNHYLADELEREGVEVVLPELMGFAKYCCYNALVKQRIQKEGIVSAFFNKIALDVIDFYEAPVKKKLNGTRFKEVSDIYHLAKNVKQVLSTGNQTGEGWFLTAEMLELMEQGVNNIVCVQPFACLPNHIVGKAVIKKISELHPLANIVPIDYDPGASHSNQTNRIKLMLTVAKDNLSKIKK